MIEWNLRIKLSGFDEARDQFFLSDSDRSPRDDEYLRIIRNDPLVRVIEQSVNRTLAVRPLLGNLLEMDFVRQSLTGTFRKTFCNFEPFAKVESS